MRVLWLSHFVPWPAAGAGMLQRSHHLLREAARRFEVHLFALNDTRLLSGPAEVREAREALAKPCARVEIFEGAIDGSRWRRARTALGALLAGRPFDVQRLRHPGLSERLAAEPPFDLVHVDTIGLFPYVEERRGEPRVLNHHNVESAMMRRRADRERRAPARLYLAREADRLAGYERIACSRADANLVVSELDAGRLRSVAGSVRTRVVSNGVDTEFFRPRCELGHGGGGIVFAGGMDWYPNRDAALYFARDIWPRLRQENARRRATLIGRSPPDELLALGRSTGIDVPGFVDDVRPLIDAASIYLCPIRDGGGTRLKILDALAMAKPLVATALAVEGLGLEEERDYLRAETPEQFAHQVARLERDDALRRRLARRGRALVEARYAWPVIGEGLADAYREAAEEATASARSASPGTARRNSTALADTSSCSPTRG